jgi:hypothetical protein
MGHSFESVRMGVQELSVCWARAGRAMRKEDQAYEDLREMAKGCKMAKHAKKIEESI